MSKKKIEGICHICGNSTKLTFEHLPPKKSFNSNRIIAFNGEELIKKKSGEQSEFIIFQKGMGDYTICDHCNNTAGSWYTKHYIDIANDIRKRFSDQEHLLHGSTVEISFNDMPALGFIKQVVAMFCSIISFEEVKRLGFDQLLLVKENNVINSELFDILMYITIPKNKKYAYCKETLVFQNNSTNEFDYANIVEISASPFGFVLNLNPKVNLEFGISIKKMFSYSYSERINFKATFPRFDNLIIENSLFRKS